MSDESMKTYTGTQIAEMKGIIDAQTAAMFDALLHGSAGKPPDAAPLLTFREPRLWYAHPYTIGIDYGPAHRTYTPTPQRSSANRLQRARNKRADRRWRNLLLVESGGLLPVVRKLEAHPED